jgi:L-ascorbate metabolism protein UlaG (beta-lactamase superfamily)
MDQTIKTIKLTYFGNSCILITAADGTRIVSDPYGKEHPAGLDELPKNLAADAVTISHIHEDHNNTAAVGGNPRVLTEPGVYQVGSIRVTGFPGWEGSPHGPNHEMRNLIFAFETDGMKIVQLGDSGIITDEEILQAVENADLVVVSIDGYVIPDDEVIPFMKRIKARTVLLAHYTLAGQIVWSGAPTADEFIQAYASDAKVIHPGSVIDVFSGMPEQIAVMKPVTLIKSNLVQ